ncbi:lysophospholipid acyltransferase family protein [Ramlibacter sp. MMS24-I3-19]|uniref:lysophospholipid acyltransferase family protein n=1 Tax=Ramlibacter sp. MMS24-I3-19 TaxID=3416606 RepID=UPI003D09188B
MPTDAVSLRRVRQVILFAAMLLWLGAMLLLGNLLCLPLIVLPRHVRQPLIQAAISTTLALFLAGASRCGLMRLDLSALDALNGERGLLLAANHPSMIDVFLVVSRVRHVACLMKASIGFNLFLAVGAWLGGYISNRRVDRMIRQASEAAAAGQTVLAFPEGTRTTTQPVNRLKPGLALIAKRSKAPLQVILIETNSPYLGQGWKIWRPPQFPLVYKATLGPRLQPSSSVSETARQLQECFENALSLSINPCLKPS